MRRVARAAPDWDSGTRPSFGLPRLRELIATRHRAELPAMGPQQVMTAAGSLGAVMCLLQAWTGPGDAVLVESPAPRQLRRLIHTLGRRMLEVPRRGGCLDIGTLDSLAALLPAASGQRLLFLSTAVSNPLGVCMSPQGAHQALQAAERHDLRVIEMDTWRGLSPLQAPSLAAMDGLQRVAQVGGVSTTLSAKLRLAHVLLPQRWVDDPCTALPAHHARAERVRGTRGLRSAGRRQLSALSAEAQHGAEDRRRAHLVAAHRRGGCRRCACPMAAPFSAPAGPSGIEPRSTSDAVLQEARKQGLPLAAAADFTGTPQPFRVVSLQRRALRRRAARALPRADEEPMSAARPPAVKRQARRQNIEGAILAVAQERFALHGYGGVSVDDIAADAGISKQSLLYYFPSKKALYSRVFNDVLDSWLSKPQQPRGCRPRSACGAGALRHAEAAVLLRLPFGLAPVRAGDHFAGAAMRRRHRGQARARLSRRGRRAQPLDGQWRCRTAARAASAVHAVGHDANLCRLRMADAHAVGQAGAGAGRFSTSPARPSSACSKGRWASRGLPLQPSSRASKTSVG
jgi:AcrR family transcriptional regulator/aspartate/methionine/tyrosine aminotransferase